MNIVRTDGRTLGEKRYPSVLDFLFFITPVTIIEIFINNKTILEQNK